MLRAIDFHGLKGVEFSKGEYTALLIPEMGANLVRLANTRLGAEILRTPGPGEIETFRSRPQVFGLPILFPPNRIADGRYVFEGRTYQYPITIERERNYHHGVLKSEAFLVSKARETDREVMIECRYYANAGNDAVYRDFPHEFKCKICGTTEGKCPTAVPSRRHGPRTPPTPPIPRPKGFGPLTRASRGARLSACMRNSGKKRGSTGDPLFCLKTSRGRPSRRAVCAACRGGWDRPPGRRRSRSAGCSRVRRSPEGRTPRARLRV